MGEKDISSTKRNLILLAIGLFTFMSTLDSSIVNIALPTISKSLGIMMNQATWTVSIYLIGVSALLIFFGRLGDLVGKIRIFKYGTIIFTIGSFLCGLNLGLNFLLFARFFQSVGAAMTMSNSFGITTSTFPPHQRARAMSMVGVFVALGGVTGPGLGGLLLQFLPWSFIFWVNVPIGILAILLGQKLFPKEEKKVIRKGHLDLLGTFSFFLFITSLFLGIEVGQNAGFLTRIPLLLFGIALLIFLFFLRLENRLKHPMIHLGLFRNSLFTVSVTSAMLIFVTNFFANILMPFYLQDLLKLEPGEAGMLLMTFPIVMMIFGPVGGYLGDHFNKEILTVIGIIIVTVAQFGYTNFSSKTTILSILSCTVVNAIGTSLFQSPNNALVMQSVDKQYLGVAGSVNALARNLGMIIGISAATTTLYTVMSSDLGKRVTSFSPGQEGAFVNGMHIAFYVSFALSILTLCMTLLRFLLNKSK
ncbi:MAG: MFS transporter, partial [Streptococcaceae bacterium]|nr:MFS transporter [Streptococcaceae bacterium]